MTQRLLTRLRRLCLSLPDAVETDSWGHPNFRARKRTFAVYEIYKGCPSLAVKPPRPEGERLLADPRFYRTPYTGKQGWVSLRVAEPVPWSLVRALVLQSYREVVPAVRSAGRTTPVRKTRRR